MEEVSGRFHYLVHLMKPLYTLILIKLGTLLKTFPELEIATLHSPQDFNTITTILIGQNTPARAVDQGVHNYIKENNLHLRYDIFHHCSASSVNLQIIDYIGWAINRKYEHDDNTYYKKVQKYILSEDIVTKDRERKYYEKWPSLPIPRVHLESLPWSLSVDGNLYSSIIHS